MLTLLQLQCSRNHDTNRKGETAASSSSTESSQVTTYKLFSPAFHFPMLTSCQASAYNLSQCLRFSQIEQRSALIDCKVDLELCCKVFMVRVGGKGFQAGRSELA